MEPELLVRRLVDGLLGNNGGQAQQASGSSSAGGHNSGTQGSFTNNGSGPQNFRDVNYNSGAYSGNRNAYHYDNYGGSLIHNGGTTQGNGNGSMIFGSFDSSTRH